MSNSILNQLPQCYRRGGNQTLIADALTRSPSDTYDRLIETLRNYPSLYLDPATALPEWLDVLAYWGGWGDYWDGSWTVAQKRSLLTHNDYIWRNRGNREILPFLFGVFGLNASLKPLGGFILNSATLGGTATLGTDPFNFAIAIPTIYGVGSPERRLISKLAKNFLPCWIGLSFVTV